MLGTHPCPAASAGREILPDSAANEPPNSLASGSVARARFPVNHSCAKSETSRRVLIAHNTGHRQDCL